MAAKVTIYTKLGVAIIDAYDYVYTGTHMGERKVTVEVKSPIEIEFTVGDYIVFERENERFTLQSIPIGNRVYNSLMITYNLDFWWRGYELKTINFLDYVDGTENPMAYNRNTGEVIVTGTIVQLMDRIKANMNRAYNDGWYGSWNYSIHASVDTDIIKDIELQNAKCWDALLLVNSLFGLEYFISFDSRVILVGYPPDVANYTFEFGKDNGLCEITRLQPETSLVTRVYAYGSTQNIPSDYRTGQYAHGYMPRLMLPAATYPNGYMANTALETIYGIREDYFIDDTIFPTIPASMNTIDEVLPILDAPSANDTIEEPYQKQIDLNPVLTWFYDENGNRVYDTTTAYENDVTEIKYTLPSSFLEGNGMNYNEVTVFIDTPLDINAANVIGDGNLKAEMSFKTGMLQGVTLQINSWTREIIDGVDTGRKKVVLQRDTNDTGYQLPNSNVVIAAGDQFVLLNIKLPDAYIADAESRLETAAAAWLATNAGEPLAYNISVPEEFVARTHLTNYYDYYFREGCAIPISDTVLNVDATYLVQSVSITYKSEKLLPEYNLTISNKPIKSRFAALEAEIKSARQRADGIGMQTEYMANNLMKSASVFQQQVTNPYGEIRGSLIEPQSILPIAMGTDLKSARYVLTAYLQVNYQDDENSVYGSDGVMVHKDSDIIWGDVYDLAHRTWDIEVPQTFSGLDPASYYWVYIKGNLEDGKATWVVSNTQLAADSQEGFYMFEWGQVLPVIGDLRYSQFNYGRNQVSAYVYISYGSSLAGDDFTLINDDDLDYMAILSTVIPLDPPVVDDFDGLWFKRRGEGTSATVSISAGDGMDFTTITDTGDVVMGTPSTVDSNSTNSVTETSHTHRLGEFSINNIVKYAGYGALYNQHAVLDSRNITNYGDFRVPYAVDFENLFDSIDIFNEENQEWPLAGGILKEQGLNHWLSPNTAATNNFNFNAFGSSFRSDEGFDVLGDDCYLWSQDSFTEEGFVYGRTFAVFCNISSASIGASSQYRGLGVRLVRDASSEELLLDDGTLVDDYVGNNGNTYHVVKIGSLCWMNQNLNETRFRNGDYITGYDGASYTPISNGDWESKTTEAMCYHNDDESIGGEPKSLPSLIHNPVQIAAESSSLAQINEQQELNFTGASGSFTTADSKTVTVVNGIITSIV